MGHPSRASEFPNDNVDISSGARWLVEQLTGPAAAELPSEPAFASSDAYEPVRPERFVLCFDDDDPADLPLDLALTPSGPELVAHGPHPEPETPAALRRFEGALARVLMARGASRAAALLPHFIRLSPLPADALSPPQRACLVARGYVDENDRYSAPFRRLWGAWSAVLSGTSEDLSDCGSTTLDHFGAQLLACLLGAETTRTEELRRELRKAGVAAFGVLEAAA